MMNLNKITIIALSCALGLAPTCLAQEEEPALAPTTTSEVIAEPVTEPVAEPVTEPVAEPVADDESTEELDEEQADDESADDDELTEEVDEEESPEYVVQPITEDTARVLYGIAPQSVKNVYIFYFSHYYACMGKTVEDYGEDTVDSAYFDIFIDQVIYMDIPEEITVELPEEFQAYLKALALIWTKALDEADALGDDADEDDYSEIYDSASAKELALMAQYPQALTLTQKLMPHLATILFEECGMDEQLEAASDSLRSSTSSEQEYYAKVLDFMSTILFEMIE